MQMWLRCDQNQLNQTSENEDARTINERGKIILKKIKEIIEYIEKNGE